MSVYVAVCRRVGTWWAIDVSEVPGVHTQARRLGQAADMAREAVALLLDIPESQVSITLDVRLEGEVERVARKAREAREAAVEAEETALMATRIAALELKSQGLPLRDVGMILGITHQRVSQLTSGQKVAS